MFKPKDLYSERTFSHLNNVDCTANCKGRWFTALAIPYEYIHHERLPQLCDNIKVLK